MNDSLERLVNDEYAGEPPTKRIMAYIQKNRENGKKVAGIYCGYAPLEIIRAADAIPAVLCAFAEKTIADGEKDLPSNLCPLIKSSYGFIVTDTCPFYSLSDVVIAETTCDGKKKMFEMIAGIKPTHVMDLPQLPDQEEALTNWTVMIKRLKAFLEKTLECTIDDDEVKRQIRETNRKNRLLNEIFAFAAVKPSPLNWADITDLAWFGQPVATADMAPLLEQCLETLKRRVAKGAHHGKVDAPRVLVTGCPVGGDAGKVFNIIEESGGSIVVIDNCTGMKPYADLIDETNDDPYEALAQRYLNLPCSCMTPNSRRLAELDRMIATFSPDVVIDVVLHACHSYNIESQKIRNHVNQTHGLPFLKIETDYSQSDVGQLRTRVEALFETMVR